MTVDSVDNKKINELPNGWQTFVFGFVVVVTILLVALPTLPTLISNLTYSFSGDNPKIYWYLSRASGFVTLTILWVSMGLGLGITNKMARLWPGAPTAFAMHQFTSLLGLAFAVYHALVLMGDHFVDFSFPRLVMPFSIEYQRFWVGLGQLCFYLWALVVATFYFRQQIGPKVWRLIHYLNFVVYAIGFLHGIKSGTDSHDTWAVSYFVVSGMGILILLGYRVHDVLLKKQISLPALALAQLSATAEKFRTAVGAITQININLPRASHLWEQARTLLPSRKTTTERLLERIEDSPSPEVTLDPGSASETPRESSLIKVFEGTVDGRKFRVRIFKEPTENPIPEIQRAAESKQQRMKILSDKVRDTLQKVHAEQSVSEHRSARTTFSED